MLKAIEDFVIKKDNGLMLLDLPTGFGKTTAVLEYIKNYIYEKNPIPKKIFFVATLKNNLPDKKLKKLLGNDFEKYCVFLKPYWQSVSENWSNVKINNLEIKNTDEYKNLELDIDTLRKFKKDKKCLSEVSDFGNEYKQTKKLIKAYENKIEKDTEIKFRQMLKQTYFYNKSNGDKEKFVKNNEWILDIYPACKLKNESCKVIICSTKKFFSPIDTFLRMPYYIYNDPLTENTVTFIDEFDTTKETLLNQIIEDGLKIDLDVFSLFLNIYFSLKNLKFPNSLLKLSDYRKEKIKNEEWTDIGGLLNDLKEDFFRVYDDNNLERMTKSKGFEDKKAFIFDDGVSLNILNDTSKKQLQTELDDSENNVVLLAKEKVYDKKDASLFENILKQVNRSVESFIKKVAYISKNYTDYKNQSLKGFQTRYTFEESVLTVLSAFNISDAFKQILLNRIIDKNANLKLDLPTASQFGFMRKGFQFTEIEDDHNHDLQTKSHSFSFNTTPEDIITKLSLKSRVVGISATASIETVIGNYDIKYLKDILRENFYSIDSIEKKRLSSEFKKTQIKYETEKIVINTSIVDDIELFSDKEKSKYFLELLFKEDLLEKYIKILENQKNYYHFFITCKIAWLYKTVGFSKEIYSFLAFLNSFPIEERLSKNSQFINLEVLNEMLKDISTTYNFTNAPILHIVPSNNFEETFIDINNELKEGKKVFVLSTYKTVGNGKNIQYEIPNIEEILNNVFKDESDTRNEKDFDAIYLLTPTNLVQNLRFNSENKIRDLCTYLFQQEYLYLNNYLTYSQRKINIENGFRKTFYGDKSCFSYKRNPDVLLNTAQLIIQAVGRICRCRNKNKVINIFTDKEVVERLKLVLPQLEDGIYNKEFIQLLNKTTNEKCLSLERYSIINKSTFIELKNKARHVRKSEINVIEWKELRDYVLKHPTASFILDKYKKFYFYFDDPYSGYTFKQDNKYNFKDIKFTNNYSDNQVSAEDCDLTRLANIKQIREFFVENGYAIDFDSNNYIMSQSLYKQIYKGALGEVVGKYIIEKAFDIELEELDDYTMYEFFDYKYKNIYFDLKHWDTFQIENDEYSKKVKRKLNQINGAKAILVNIYQRGNHILKTSKDETIIQVPYIINEDNEIDYSKLGEIEEVMDFVN